MGKTICVDLDGVLNQYAGWKGEEHYPDPREGAGEFLQELHRCGYEVVIFTTRNPDKTADWLQTHSLYWDKVTDRKVPATAYIDDRAICFRGDFVRTLADLLQFHTHWEI